VMVDPADEPRAEAVDQLLGDFVEASAGRPSEGDIEHHHATLQTLGAGKLAGCPEADEGHRGTSAPGRGVVDRSGEAARGATEHASACWRRSCGPTPRPA